MPSRPRRHYTEVNPAIKYQYFNKPVSEHYKKYVRIVPHDTEFIVMDAGHARTSRALRRAKITNRITVFTNNPADYNMIPARELNVEKLNCDADVLYPALPYCKSRVVIHDSSQTAINTLDVMRPLFKRRVPKLSICVTISLRCTYYSHITFESSMRDLARIHGYTQIRSKPLDTYSQSKIGGAKMKAYIFTFWR